MDNIFKKITILIVICFLSFGGWLGYRLYNANHKNSSNKYITINRYGTSQPYLKFMLPYGWVNAPYWPDKDGVGRGMPISLFASSNEKNTLDKLLEQKPENFSEGLLNISTRFIEGDGLSPATNNNKDLISIEKLGSSPYFSQYDKLIINTKYFTGGSFRCLKLSKSKKIVVRCKANYKDQYIDYFSLYTFEKKYQEDFSALSHVIESAEKL